MATSFARVARLVGVERAVAVRNDGVPAASDRRALVLEMEVETGAAASLERHLVVEPGLPRKRLEQRGQAADSFVVEVVHGITAVVTHCRAGAVGKTVTDEQHALGSRTPRAREHEGNACDQRRSKPHDSHPCQRPAAQPIWFIPRTRLSSRAVTAGKLGAGVCILRGLSDGPPALQITRENTAAHLIRAYEPGRVRIGDRWLTGNESSRRIS